MAKISIDVAKNRLINQEQIFSASKNTTVKPEKIEYVNTVNNNIYIFKTNESYVLSPADDQLSPVIGEFDEITDDGTMPPCLQDWLNVYSSEIKYFQDNEEQLLIEYATEKMLENSDGNIFGAGSIELVDLGLSVKWATTNLGADKPESIGNFYAWGELEPKTSYTVTNYKYYDSSTKKYINIGKNISKNINYDPAYKLDINLCIPTETQFKELIDKCTWTKKTINNVIGYEVKGPNGKTIFIPCSGCKSESSEITYKDHIFLMSSNSYANTDYQFNSLRFCDNPQLYLTYKRTGIPIRPVSANLIEDENKLKLVDLGLSVQWANMNLGAKSIEDGGDFYAWGELEPKTNFEWTNYAWDNSSSTTNKSLDLGKNISKNVKYDVAYKLNKSMCLPTDTQWEELLSKCKLTDKIINNKKVCEVTGPNGNSIVLPYAGYKVGTTLTKYNTHCCLDSASIYSSNTNKYAKTLDLENGNNRVAYSRKMLGRNIRPVSVATKVLRKTIKPLIPYKWGQKSPFYNGFPLDPSTGKTVVTGCSNTALAMIMAYYGCIGINGKKFRRGCPETQKYVTKAGTKSQQTIPALKALPVFDYDNLNYNTGAEFKTSTSLHAVNELMKYIGYASKSEYTSKGTGSNVYTVLDCVINTLNLGSKAVLIKASQGMENFKNKIYNELEQGYPVNVYGWNKTLTSGHAFICDGYDVLTNKYHFNWGWSGSYDGWFDLNLLNPSTKDFSYSQYCIVGLHPDYIFGDTNNDDEITISDVMNVVKSIVDKKEYEKQLDINSDGKINEDDIQLLVNQILGKKIYDDNI